MKKWNDTAVDYPHTKSLSSLLSLAAATYPDKTALIFTGTISNHNALTYKELDKRANQMAHAIRNVIDANHTGTTPVVGVMLERSPELVITLLAVLKAGAAYVPIDPEYPQERTAFMLADSGATVLITSQEYAADTSSKTEGVAKNLPTVIQLETLLTECNPYPDTPPDVAISGHDLAYILYTSGSTGQPKGVQVEHRNLINLLYGMVAWPGITNKDVLLAVTTVSFDIAGLELFLPLLVGATVLLADTETTKNGSALLNAVTTHGVTVIQATPVTYKMMLAAGWEQPLPLKILCCGEPLAKDLAQKLTARCQSLWNMYGPTETTIYSTGKQILATDEVITIGKPIQNTQIYILDEHLNPVPGGSIGEIYIAGDGVARGYLNRPDLTRERFIDNPFEPAEKGKMYRTGDLGMFTENGEVNCLGRIDQQVKVRGYRIELGEIEYTLTNQVGITEVVVMAREDRPGDQRLVAYVVPIKPLSPETFRSQVLTWRAGVLWVLPGYMVPNDFVQLDQLPITPNGKIDRKALPRPVPVLIPKESQSGLVTKTEKMVAAIWKKALETDEISRDTDFFEAGGHSMIAIQVMTQLEKETGKRLPLSTLFTHPTVRELADLICRDAKPENWKSLVPIQPNGSKMPLYIIHGIGLNLLNFSGMVSYMDPEQPIYGLQALGLDGDDDPLDNMEAIAERYLSEVLDQNPDGPYAIGGYSFGGYVALEMARQLRKMGKEVKLLAMFDTNAQESESTQKGLARLTRKLGRQLPKLAWFSRSLVQDPIATLQYQRGYVKRLFNSLLKKTGSHGHTPVQNHLDRLQRIMEKHEIAFHTYSMQPYDGVVDLFKAKRRVYYVDDLKFLGWKKYALRGVRVHDVPGDHATMLLPPHDKTFARALQKALDRT